MRQVAREFNKVSIDDFFADRYYFNFERIIAAKKKFHYDIPDTSFSIRIANRYVSGAPVEKYSIMYRNGKPFSSTAKIRVDSVSRDTFKFTYFTGADTIGWSGTTKYMSDPGGRRDSFMDYGEGFRKDVTLKEATTHKNLMRETPDTQYWAYKIFYWIL